jgi:DNA-binding SARP family transcriptional activator/predicted ATPase
LATLQVYLLGSLGMRYGNVQLAKPPTLKSQSLLAYLVHHRRQPLHREQLAGLFFGERNESKARHSLSTALWHIRRCLPDASVILNDSQTVQFDPHSALWLDVEEFEALAARSEAGSLHSAIALYRGDFLDGFYDDWTVNERYRLESLYLETLARLITIYEVGKDYQAVLVTALRLLDRDALREDAHQAAMRAYSGLGQRKAALEQYERCRGILHKELGAEPMIETRNLHQAILSGSFVAEPSPGVLSIESVRAGATGHDPLDVTATVKLAGREKESLFLEDCLRAVQKRGSRLVLICGEAGVGKTRLVEDFANRLRWQGIQVLWGRCFEFERVLPYQPVADALRSSLPLLPQEELAGIPAWALREVARLVPELLERPTMKEMHKPFHRKIAADTGPSLPTLSGVDPEQARLFAGVKCVLEALSAHRAILVVLDDLHWASESTLQMLHYLARYRSSHPVLMIGTFRSEAIGIHHPLQQLQRTLSGEGLAESLSLSRLSGTAVETIIVEMSGAGNEVLPLAKRLYRETEGNPFFLMEIVKALFEAQAIQMKEAVWQADYIGISQGDFPQSPTVSEAIQLRVQRLGENAQDGLNLAAVLGREFNYELLHAAWGKSEEATLEMLDELLRHRLIEERAGPNESDFAFAHHTIQETVYQSLPRFRRFHLHAQVGAAMETLYADELETRTSELAHHFEQACHNDSSLRGKAIGYLRKAGQQASQQFAHQETVAYYKRSLDILQNQPETAQRIHQEVDIQLSLAAPITAMKGYASQEAKRVFARAYALCQKLGEAPELFTSLVGLTRYYGLTGDHETAGILAKQLLAIAKAAGEPSLLLEAYRQMAGLLFSSGNLEEARQYWENGLGLYPTADHELQAQRYGHDVIITCLGYLSMALWMMGYPEQSMAKSQNLYNLIPSLPHAPSQAYGYCLLALQACLRSAAQETLDHAEAAIHIAQSHGLSSWMNLATALKGWALFEQGKVEEGESMLKEGTEAWQAQGFAHFTPILLSLQADACLKLQKLNDGMEAILAAQAILKGGMDLYWEAELYRLQGELLRALGNGDERAEKCFRLGKKTALRQNARMLELHAAMSLAHLLQYQDQPRAAQQVLAEVYDKFTEGFGTFDLKRAGELLLKLAQQPLTS